MCGPTCAAPEDVSMTCDQCVSGIKASIDQLVSLHYIKWHRIRKSFLANLLMLRQKEYVGEIWLSVGEGANRPSLRLFAN